MQRFFSLMNSVQRYLFPHIESELGPLSEKEKEFVRMAELAGIGRHINRNRWCGNGRKPHSRESIALAFLAKSHWNIPTTLALIDYLKANRNLQRLCGWESTGEIPSSPTFSRTFAEFSQERLAERVHGSMLAVAMEGNLSCHGSIDSAQIEAREKAVGKPKEGKSKEKKKPGPKKGQKRKEKHPTRLDLQPWRTLEENLFDLPAVCDYGVKRNSKGFMQGWKGYKLHLLIVDGGIPAGAILTSASVHDSQVAIPLMQMAQERLVHFYDLGDAAYDAEQIKEYSLSQGRVPVIDANRRSGEKPEMCPAKKTRYKERTTVERAFSNLKDNYGGRFIRVKGAAKVMAHLMFGVLALTAMQLIRMLE